VTQTATVTNVGVLQRSTKMLLRAKRRTPMTMILLKRMTLHVEKGRLNQAALEVKPRKPKSMTPTPTPILKEANGWIPPRTPIIVLQTVTWT
jgi:hypothetical protein